MSDRKKFLKGITSGYAYMAFSMIVALWMVPYVLKFLTKSEYGIFAIAGDLLGWLSIANLGVTSAFGSRSGHILGRRNSVELNALFNTTFFTQLGTSIVIIVAGIIVSFNTSLVFGSEIISENITLVVSLMVVGFYLQYITQPLNTFLIADKQVHIDNYLRFGVIAIQTILSIILLNFGFKLMSLALSSLLSNLIVAFITWFRITKSFPNIVFSIKYFQKDKFADLLKHGLWFSIGGVAGILILRMDTFLIGKYISLALVASFVINNKLYQITDKFHGQLFNTLRPFIAQEFGTGNYNKLNLIYNLMYFSSFLFALTFGGVVYFLGPWFIRWWVGPEYYLGEIVNVLIYLNFVVQAVVLPNRIILSATLHRNKHSALTRIAEGVVKIVLCLIFVKYKSIEIILIISICSSLLFSNIVLNYFTLDLLKDELASKLLPFISLFFIVCMFFTSNLWSEILLFTTSVFTAIVIFYFFCNKNGISIKLMYDFVKKKT